MRVLAEGGMGILVEAVHLALEQRVALKFPLVPAGVDAEEARSRLRREARAAAALKGQHVCRIFDVGELASGEPFLVMELLEGEDLGARVGRPMSVRRAAELVRQACLGVAEAHARGIVHRDLKPENLFVAADHLGRPSVKVLDFGISKVPRDRRRTGATTRDAMGSPLYMSPEQMRSTSDVDARADVWSLGVILYELVAGVAPFDAPSVPEICVRVLAQAPRPLTEVRPDVPEAFAALVHRCLDKDVTRRAADASELARELACFARGEVVPVDRGRVSTAPSSRDASPAAAVSVVEVKPARRGGWIAGAVFAAAVIGLGFAALARVQGVDAVAAPAAAGPATAQERVAPPPAPSAAPADVASPRPDVVAVDAPSVPPFASASVSAAPAAAPAAPVAVAHRRAAAASTGHLAPLRNYVAPSGPEGDPVAADAPTADARDIYEPSPSGEVQPAAPR